MEEDKVSEKNNRKVWKKAGRLTKVKEDK